MHACSNVLGERAGGQPGRHPRTQRTGQSPPPRDSPTPQKETISTGAEVLLLLLLLLPVVCVCGYLAVGVEVF